MKNPCPFCGSANGRNSAEHWLPDSWEQYLTVPLVMLDTAVVDGRPRELKVNNRSPFDIKFEGTCSTCNNGWMKDVDEAAREAVIPYATDETSVPHEGALDRIARHLTRTALMTTWGQARSQRLSA